MSEIPKTRQKIRELLYEQVPLLIKKLEDANANEARQLVEAIIEIWRLQV